MPEAGAQRNVCFLRKEVEPGQAKEAHPSVLTRSQQERLLAVVDIRMDDFKRSSSGRHIVTSRDKLRAKWAEADLVAAAVGLRSLPSGSKAVPAPSAGKRLPAAIVAPTVSPGMLLPSASSKKLPTVASVSAIPEARPSVHAHLLIDSSAVLSDAGAGAAEGESDARGAAKESSFSGKLPMAELGREWGKGFSGFCALDGYAATGAPSVNFGVIM